MGRSRNQGAIQTLCAAICSVGVDKSIGSRTFVACQSAVGFNTSRGMPKVFERSVLDGHSDGQEASHAQTVTHTTARMGARDVTQCHNITQSVFVHVCISMCQSITNKSQHGNFRLSVRSGSWLGGWLGNIDFACLAHHPCILLHCLDIR